MSEYIEAYKTAGAAGFLLIFIILSIAYIAKYGKQAFESMLKKTEELQSELRKQDAEKEQFYKERLELQKQESEIRIKELRKELKEERLNSESERKKFIEQLEVINRNTAKTANILEKLENKFDSLNAEIMNIKENIK